MTSGEGGIILTNDGDLADRCDSYLWAGREKGRPWYEFHRLGWNYRLTEFQAAILLVQLQRLEDQNQRRMENARYLDRRLAELAGVEPLSWDPRASKHSHHIYILRYDAQHFCGVHRERFVEALAAEGIPAFSGYTFPIYANPMFVNQDFNPLGCPVQCPHYGIDVDFASYKARCPVTEKACNEESVWLEHRLLLGTKKDMDDIAEAIHKIKAHAAEMA
jgi:dTDP-4-amino-4,6-dideoxygalactose transaminase